MDAFALENQSALVTGGASGIGAGVCVALARSGARVGVNYLSGKRDADALVRQIEGEGGKAIAIKADVADEGQVARMFERFVKAFGRIDILVANAGIQKDAPIERMTLAQWEAVMGSNATGQFLCAREAIRRFLAQPRSRNSRSRGKVICMSSVHEKIPWAGHVNYAASKGAVHSMMESLAQEVAGRGIRVNAVAPGAIRTPINASQRDTPAERRKLLKLIPYGRVGEPEDVASAVTWLASDASDYVVGATLFVDGGMALYPAFRGNG